LDGYLNHNCVTAWTSPHKISIYTARINIYAQLQHGDTRATTTSTSQYLLLCVPPRSLFPSRPYPDPQISLTRLSCPLTSPCRLFHPFIPPHPQSPRWTYYRKSSPAHRAPYPALHTTVALPHLQLRPQSPKKRRAPLLPRAQSRHITTPKIMMNPLHSCQGTTCWRIQD
jgi:hypothetical protein